MRNKTKKILAGLGIGLTLTGSGLLMTGCKSDIEFNQKDLDLAISNVNEYLETQNNYSSEFARNTLNGYLMNAMEDSLNTTNFKFICKDTEVDLFGNKNSKTIGEYKFYNNGNIIKEYAKLLNGIENYKETTIDENGKYDTITYSLKTKTYTSENDLSEIVPLASISGISSYFNAIVLINYMLHEESFGVCDDFIMENIDENTVKFKTIMNGSDGTLGNQEFVFQNGKLIQMVNWYTYDISSSEFGKNLTSQEFIFEHDIDDFDIDKTGYTQA